MKCSSAGKKMIFRRYHERVLSLSHLRKKLRLNEHFCPKIGIFDRYFLLIALLILLDSILLFTPVGGGSWSVIIIPILILLDKFCTALHQEHG